MRRAVLATALLCLGAPALAEQPKFSDLVADTVGYTSIRPNVVMLEGDEMGTFVCRFKITDEDFATYAASGEIDEAADRVVCIPIKLLEN